MKQQLTINHLAKRLPYGVKLCFENSLGKEYIERLVGIYIPERKEDPVRLSTELDEINLDEAKPILFPIDCLTKEITVNGETFVPIDELVRIELTSGEYRKLNSGPKNIYQNNNNCVFEFFENDQRYSFYYSKKWGCFRFSKKDSETNETKTFFVFEQKLLLDKLLEWHIDTDNLIESGLAISVLELNQNPYA